MFVQLPAVKVESPRPDVGYTVPVVEKVVAHGSGDGHMTSSRLPPSTTVVKKRVGRPRKADVEVGVAPVVEVGVFLCCGVVYYVKGCSIASPHSLVAQERGSSFES